MPHVAKAFDNSSTGLSALPLYSLTELRVDKATGRLLISSTNGVGPNTEYSEGTTASSAIGIAFLVKDSNNILRVAKSDTAGVLRVQQADLNRSIDDVSVYGAFQNNSIASATTTENLGVLAAMASATTNLWTEGKQVVLLTDLAGNLKVINGGTFAVSCTNAGVFPVQVTTSSTCVNAGTFPVQVTTSATCVGDIASGSTNVTNPLQVGGRSATQLPTAVGDAQRVAGMFDKYGRQPVLPFGLREQVNPITQITLSSTAETTLIAAVGGVFNDITTITIANTSTTATQVDFRDSTAGTVRWTAYVPGTDMRGIVFSVPLPQASTSSNWTAKCVTVSNVIISGQYIANK